MSGAFATLAPGLGTHAPSVRAYTDRRRAMHLTMRATFLFFLAATLLRRLNPFARNRSAQSVVAETRARAAAIIPFIFMG